MKPWLTKRIFALRPFIELSTQDAYESQVMAGSAFEEANVDRIELTTVWK